jgi:hypothetical protein
MGHNQQRSYTEGPIKFAPFSIMLPMEEKTENIVGTHTNTKELDEPFE